MYFNGNLYGVYKRVTRIYCDKCAETAIPLPAIGTPLKNGEPCRKGSRHWDTEFKWAPYFGGDTKCQECNTPV